MKSSPTLRTCLSLGLLMFALNLPAATADYSEVGKKLEPIVQQEMKDWGITGISVALVDDQDVVYAKCFGDAKRDSIFRVGSISKLFNAVAVMQQVEAGKLDLDAPLPEDVLPLNPFADQPAVTLRQMLSHRSGLQRESAVGGYLDISGPGLKATVESIRQGVLVTRPPEKTRYSNIAPSIAGHMVERVSGQDYETYQQEHVLGPLGMDSSAWTVATVKRDRIVVSHMRVADGEGGWERIETPLFDLGTIPAGNLFSTVDDLGKFASALMANDGKLVKPETLAEMWKPQFTDNDGGFGLGFAIGKFREHRRISHSGAVYGYSTTLLILPEAKVAAIVLGNEDIANGRISQIGSEALSLILQAKLGEEPPAKPEPYEPKGLKALIGNFESESYWATISVKKGTLVGDISGQPTTFTPTGENKFAANSRIASSAPVTFVCDEAGKAQEFTFGGQTFKRVPEQTPALPPIWRKYLGSYGVDIIPLIVHEKFGHLYAMTENMVDYRLTPINANVCGLPPGMYVNEEVVFLTNRKGRVHAINYANMHFPRRK